MSGRSRRRTNSLLRLPELFGIDGTFPAAIDGEWVVEHADRPVVEFASGWPRDLRGDCVALMSWASGGSVCPALALAADPCDARNDTDARRLEESGTTHGCRAGIYDIGLSGSWGSAWMKYVITLPQHRGQPCRAYSMRSSAEQTCVLPQVEHNNIRVGFAGAVSRWGGGSVGMPGRSIRAGVRVPRSRTLPLR